MIERPAALAPPRPALEARIPPGPLVGRAYNFMLELRIAEGEIGQDRATQELLRWAAGEGISPPDPDPEPEPGED